MRAMRAETFSGYGGLKLVQVPKPVVSDALRYLVEGRPFGRVVLTV
jgi:hypothetical protein